MRGRPSSFTSFRNTRRRTLVLTSSTARWPTSGSSCRWCPTYNSLCGFTNLPGILSFLASHERRHQVQIRVSLAAEGLPGAA